jgi:hypothetical protein
MAAPEPVAPPAAAAVVDPEERTAASGEPQPADGDANRPRKRGWWSLGR